MAAVGPTGAMKLAQHKVNLGGRYDDDDDDDEDEDNDQQGYTAHVRHRYSSGQSLFTNCQHPISSFDDQALYKVDETLYKV